ncbi:MAG: hypothetical protein ABI239_05280 [Aquihabitans sp.]
MTPPNNEDAQVTAPRKISREDIEAQFRSLTDDVDHKAEEARSTVVTIAAVAGVVVVLGAFLFGRRRGRKSTTIVEVRRF